MKIAIQNHRKIHPKGSILIWSVMLGFVLTSVFFFFGMRQRANVAVQRDTAEILNTKAYLKSYADFLELSPTEFSGTFDEIEVKLTQIINEIEGAIDVNIPKTYKFAKEIIIEWNKCSENFKADLMINGDLYPHDVTECLPADDGFDDSVAISTSGPFTISTANAPFHFRITGIDLKGNTWYLELEKELTYGKKITVKREFKVTP